MPQLAQRLGFDLADTFGGWPTQARFWLEWGSSAPIRAANEKGGLPHPLRSSQRMGIPTVEAGDDFDFSAARRHFERAQKAKAPRVTRGLNWVTNRRLHLQF
jgi:hypothetical protein